MMGVGRPHQSLTENLTDITSGRQPDLDFYRKKISGARITPFPSILKGCTAQKKSTPTFERLKDGLSISSSHLNLTRVRAHTHRNRNRSPSLWPFQYGSAGRFYHVQLCRTRPRTNARTNERTNERTIGTLNK